MPTAWPTNVLADYAADAAATQAATRALWARQLGMMRLPFEIYFAEVTRVNNGAYGTMYSFGLLVPQWSFGASVDGGTMSLYVYLNAKKSVAGVDTTWRVRDTAGNSGTAVTVTNTAYAVSGPSVLAFNATMVEQTRSLVIEGKTAAGATLYLNGADLIHSWFSD